MNRDTLVVHIEHCPVVCKFGCGDKYDPTTIDQHSKVCPDFVIPCTFCKVSLKRKSINSKEHIWICPRACSNGCGAVLPASNQEQHNNENCPNFQLTCTHECKKQFMRKDLEAHMQICPTACTLGCSAQVAPINQQCHEDKDCPMKEIHCIENVIGCSWVGKRSAISAHLESCLFKQLYPAINMLQQFQQRYEEQHARMLQNLKAELTLPTGAIMPFAGDVAPPGWALCDGRVLDTGSPEQRPLAYLLGARFGQQGKLPDLRDRSVVGMGTTNTKIGEAIGSATHTLTVAEMPAHNHGGRVTTSTTGMHSHKSCGSRISGSTMPSCLYPAWTREGNAYGERTDFMRESGDHAHTFDITSNGENNPLALIPPSLVLNFIIKY
ncbi:hypothetical protein Pelo_16082 [Pelomyxa schiedti]|nr:hypothetical protein Pelo_16082 [Pelomyxa schiedti]